MLSLFWGEGITSIPREIAPRNNDSESTHFKKINIFLKLKLKIGEQGSTFLPSPPEVPQEVSIYLIINCLSINVSTCLNPDCFWTVSDIFLFSISILSCKHITFSLNLEVTECIFVCPLLFQELILSSTKSCISI